MPMIEFKGLPHDTPQKILAELQDNTEEAIAQVLGCPLAICHSEPIVSSVERRRPKEFVWGHITTAFFYKEPDTELARQTMKAATGAVAAAIWRVLNGEFTVEIFPPPYMDQVNLKTMIKKRS